MIEEKQRAKKMGEIIRSHGQREKEHMERLW